jgi:hypothetical protein
MLKLALAALLIGAASAVSSPELPPTYCPVEVLRDYELGWAYYAQLRLTPPCPFGGVGRVRKTSTLSTRAQGNAYQPIRPETGAWTVTASGDNIPRSMQFTLYSWAWQYWTGKTWATAVIR